MDKWREARINEIKLVIYSQNPEPYSFVKLPLFTDGYFNPKLPTCENIHY